MRRDGARRHLLPQLAGEGAGRGGPAPLRRRVLPRHARARLRRLPVGDAVVRGR